MSKISFKRVTTCRQVALSLARGRNNARKQHFFTLVDGNAVIEFSSKLIENALSCVRDDRSQNGVVLLREGGGVVTGIYSTPAMHFVPAQM